MIHIIPDISNIDVWKDYADKYNAAFEYNDFFNTDLLDDSDRLAEAVNIYKSLQRDRKYDTLHGTFFDMVINSRDAKIREISQKRFRTCIEIAMELGCKAVVFHTNYISGFKSNSYRSSWVKDSAEFYRSLLREYRDIDIYVENMFDESPDLIKQLAKELEDESRFGICFDIAHAFLSQVSLEQWIDELQPYIKHIHINDNNGDEDAHLALGEGSIPWEILQNPKLYTNNPSILIEVKNEEKMVKSIEYLRRFIGGNYD